MDMIKWFLINSMYGFAVYMGLYHNHEGALNVALFFSWLKIVVSLFLLSNESAKKLKKQGRSVPLVISVAFSLSIIATFIWNGYWVTSVCLSIALILFEAAHKATKELSK